MTGAQPKIAGLTAITPIGRGGSARVYSAVDEATGHELAVKIIDEAGPLIDAAANLDREIRSLEALRSVPGVVAVVGHGTTTDGDVYLLMPLLSGGSCHDLIAGGKGIGWRAAARIVAKAAAAIQSAHDLGIWHRDIKPENILRTRSGETFVSDFGIARFTDGSMQSRDGTSLTPDYAPPEVFAGEPQALSDVYSLGATLTALTVGHPPFRSPTQDASPLAIMNRVANTEPPDLVSYGAPPELARIAATAMAKEPVKRQGSPQQLHDELVSCLERYPGDEDLDASPAGTTPLLLQATTYWPDSEPLVDAPSTRVGPPAGQPPTAADRSPSASPKTPRLALAVGAIVLVAVLAIVGWFTLSGEPENIARDGVESPTEPPPAQSEQPLEGQATPASVAMAEEPTAPQVASPVQARPTRVAATPTAVPPTPVPPTPVPTVNVRVGRVLDLRQLEVTDSSIAGVEFGTGFEEAIAAVTEALGIEPRRSVMAGTTGNFFDRRGNQTAIWLADPGKDSGRLEIQADDSGLMNRWIMSSEVLLPDFVEYADAIPGGFGVLGYEGFLVRRESIDWLFTGWTCDAGSSVCYGHPGPGQIQTVSWVTAPSIDPGGLDVRGRATVVGTGPVNVREWAGVIYQIVRQVNGGDRVILLGDPQIDTEGREWRLTINESDDGTYAGYIAADLLNAD